MLIHFSRVVTRTLPVLFLVAALALTALAGTAGTATAAAAGDTPTVGNYPGPSGNPTAPFSGIEKALTDMAEAIKHPGRVVVDLSVDQDHSLAICCGILVSPFLIRALNRNSNASG